MDKKRARAHRRERRSQRAVSAVYWSGLFPHASKAMDQCQSALTTSRWTATLLLPRWPAAFRLIILSSPPPPPPPALTCLSLYLFLS